MIAEEIQKNLVENEVIEKLEIAGPGFINIFLKEAYLSTFIKRLERKSLIFFLEQKRRCSY